MEMLNYTGKLNTHDSYIKILDKLESKCKFIQYVLVDEDDTQFIDRFETSILSVICKNKWTGTKTSQKAKIYKMTPSKEIFKYLKTFETFCKCKNTMYGDMAEETDFGINDIAFFDDDELPLLFTTTHEGYIFVRNDIGKE